MKVFLNNSTNPGNESAIWSSVLNHQLLKPLLNFCRFLGHTKGCCFYVSSFFNVCYAVRLFFDCGMNHPSSSLLLDNKCTVLFVIRCLHVHICSAHFTRDFCIKQSCTGHCQIVMVIVVLPAIHKNGIYDWKEKYHESIHNWGIVLSFVFQ